MDTRELEAILARHMRRAYWGVCAEDELPSTLRRPLGLIVNTDPGTLPGTHWTSVYIFHDGRAEFFDSMGTFPDLPVKRYLNHNAERGWKWNTRVVQSVVSDVCGLHCVYYLLARHHNRAIGFERLINQMYPYSSALDNDMHVISLFREQYEIEH